MRVFRLFPLIALLMACERLQEVPMSLYVDVDSDFDVTIAVNDQIVGVAPAHSLGSVFFTAKVLVPIENDIYGTSYDYSCQDVSVFATEETTGRRLEHGLRLCEDGNAYYGYSIPHVRFSF